MIVWRGEERGFRRLMSASLIGHVSQAPFVFVIGPVGFVTAWVTLLYAVGLRGCGAASIGRRGLESLAFGRASIGAQQTFAASSRPSSTRGRSRRGSQANDRGYTVATSFPHWNVEPSIHMRCMMTASLRAIATSVRRRPLVLCSRRPQALRADHRCVLPIKAFAAA